jgi:predicted ArsR family transcriptional regulator
MQSRLDALARWPGCVGITHCHARILELIERGVAIAQEMSRELGIGKPTVNHHLKRLRERGLIVVVGTIPTRTNPASVHALAGPALEASKQHRGQKEGS